MSSYQLDSVCDFINGGAWSDSEYVPSGIHVVKVTNLSDGRIIRKDDNYLPISKYEKYKQHELKKNDIIVSTVGSHPTQPGSVVGRVALVSSEYEGSFLNQNAACIRVSKPELVSQRYLYYLANTVLFKHHIESRARGSANQVRMAIGELKKFNAEYPIVLFQEKIAAVLSAYDELIENNKRRIALLEKMAEEIYREWFVRLRFPGHEKVKVVKGVPDGWDVKRLGEILELCYGKALKEEDRIFGNVPVYGSSGIVGTHNKALVNGPGIIVGRKGNVGSVHWSDCGFFTIDTAYYVNSSLSSYYLYFLLQSMNFINNDAAVPGLNRNQAYANLLYLPPVPLIQEFSVKAQQLFETKGNLNKQNDILTRTRYMLLPRLISGKLSVENLDIQFPPGMEA